MPGFMPDIPVSLCCFKDVDGRDKPGHDGMSYRFFFFDLFADDLLPLAFTAFAGRTATASISNRPPGRANAGTPMVVEAGGAFAFR